MNEIGSTNIPRWNVMQGVDKIITPGHNTATFIINEKKVKEIN